MRRSMSQAPFAQLTCREMLQVTAGLGMALDGSPAGLTVEPVSLDLARDMLTLHNGERWKFAALRHCASHARAVQQRDEGFVTAVRPANVAEDCCKYDAPRKVRWRIQSSITFRPSHHRRNTYTSRRDLWTAYELHVRLIVSLSVLAQVNSSCRRIRRATIFAAPEKRPAHPHARRLPVGRTARMSFP